MTAVTSQMAIHTNSLLLNSAPNNKNTGKTENIWIVPVQWIAVGDSTNLTVMHKKSVRLPVCPKVASIPIPGGRSLHLVKNRGGVLIKLWIKTSPYFLLPPIFHWANYTLKKTSPLFLLILPCYFSICTFNIKTFPYFSLGNLHP